MLMLVQLCPQIGMLHDACVSHVSACHSPHLPKEAKACNVFAVLKAVEVKHELTLKR